MSWQLWFSGAALLFVGVAVFAVGTFSERTVQAYSAALIATCAEAPEKEVCYEREIPELYGELSVPQLFQVIREVRARDPEYQFCHLLAHKIGARAVAEDPEQWVDIIPYNPPDGLCSNGFIHGAAIERFRDAVLEGEALQAALPDFARACMPREGWSPSSLDQAICFHGLGHLFSFVTDADLQRAADICKEVTDRSDSHFLRVCQEGVFMQVYQPVEPDDYDLLTLLPYVPDRQTYRTFCAAYRLPEERGACLREAWPLFREDIYEGKGGARTFCSGQPNKEQQDACYEAITSVAGRQSLQEPERVVRICADMPREYQRMCFNRSALAVIEEDRNAWRSAVALCARAPEASLYTGCLSFLGSVADFAFGAHPARKEMCAVLPKGVCL